MDATDIGTLLAVWGALLGVIGGVVTGVGLFIGWRRLLLRKSEELRAALQQSGGLTVTALMTGEGVVSASVTPIEGQGGPDAPVTRAQLIKVVVALQAEIQKLVGSIHGVRTDVAGLPKLTEAEVDERARRVLAEHARHESSNALRDLVYALIGIGITVVGGVLAVVGLFVGWWCAIG